MSDIERWWRDDSSIFHLRDVPPHKETAAVQTKNEEAFAGKPHQTSVGEIPLSDGLRVRPSLEDAPATAAAHNGPGSEAPDQPAQARDDAVAADGEAPGSSNRVAQSERVDEDAPKSAHQEPPPGSARRRSGGLWAAVVILALALGALTWYGSLILRQNNISLAQLPGMSQLITGLQRTDGRDRNQAPRSD